MLRLGPYGRELGLCQRLADLPQPDGLNLIIQEHGDPIQVHKTGIVMNKDQLMVVHTVDRRKPITLHRQATTAPMSLDSSLQISEIGVRAEIQGVNISIPLEGLRRDHAAEITLVLPAGSVLRYLEVLPIRAFCRLECVFSKCVLSNSARLVKNLRAQLYRR